MDGAMRFEFNISDILRVPSPSSARLHQPPAPVLAHFTASEPADVHDTRRELSKEKHLVEDFEGLAKELRRVER